MNSVKDILETTSDEMTKEVVNLRASWYTLQEVANKYNLSRERIRQIEDNFFENYIRDEEVEEEKYCYVYSHYDMSKAVFARVFNDGYGYWYASQSSRNGVGSLIDAVADDNVSEKIKKLIKSAFSSPDAIKVLGKRYLFLKNENFQMTKGNIIQHVIRNYCTESTTIPQLINKANAFLEDNGVEKESNYYYERRTEQNAHKIVSFVFRMPDIICSINEKFRYYQYDNKDWNAFRKQINLAQFMNKEISTLKLMNEMPELMKQYDIRDEYELHDVIRQKVAEYLDLPIQMKRMPIMIIGKADRYEQIENAFKVVGASSFIEILSYLNREYGYNEATISGTLLPMYKKYLLSLGIEYETAKRRKAKSKPVKNVTISPAVIAERADYTEEEYSMLSETLNDDFYVLSSLRKMCVEIVPEVANVTDAMLKKMGFFVFRTENYAIKHFRSPADFMKSIIYNKNGFILSDISEEIKAMPVFKFQLKEAVRTGKIIPFGKNGYIPASN